jgi:hypothetical protein
MRLSRLKPKALVSYNTNSMDSKEHVIKKDWQKKTLQNYSYIIAGFICSFKYHIYVNLFSAVHETTEQGYV